MCGKGCPSFPAVRSGIININGVARFHRAGNRRNWQFQPGQNSAEEGGRQEVRPQGGRSDTI